MAGSSTAVIKSHSDEIRCSVLARLLFTDQRILVFCFGFKHNERKSLLIKKQEIDKSVLCLLDIFSESIDLIGAELNIRLQYNIGFAVTVIKKTPPSFF